MTDEAKDIPQEAPKIIEVQEREFFKPFENYDEIPYRVNKEDHQRKEVLRIVNGREVKISLTRMRNITYGPEGGTINCMVALPSGFTHITNTNELKELEEKVGVKLFDLSIEYNMDYRPTREIFSPNYIPSQEDLFPYYANVQLADGSQADLLKQEPREGSPFPQSPFFTSGETDKRLLFRTLVLPERKEALDNLQVKFVPEKGRMTVI